MGGRGEPGGLPASYVSLTPALNLELAHPGSLSWPQHLLTVSLAIVFTS